MYNMLGGGLNGCRAVRYHPYLILGDVKGPDDCAICKRASLNQKVGCESEPRPDDKNKSELNQKKEQIELTTVKSR